MNMREAMPLAIGRQGLESHRLFANAARGLRPAEPARPLPTGH
jgi:hypothetical protein